MGREGRDAAGKRANRPKRIGAEVYAAVATPRGYPGVILSPPLRIVSTHGHFLYIEFIRQVAFLYSALNYW